MSLKKTIVAVTLGLGFSAFAQANYIEPDLGTLSFGNPLTVEGEPGSASGNFADWFTFSVAKDVLAGNVSAMDIMFNGSANFGAENLEIAIYKDTYTGNNLNGLVGGDYELLGSFKVDGSTTVVGSFDFDPTWDGGYTFLVSGKTTGGSAFYSFGVTAVPEPAEYAMLLAGLGVVGMVARRRKMNVN